MWDTDLRGALQRGDGGFEAWPQAGSGKMSVCFHVFVDNLRKGDEQWGVGVCCIIVWSPIWKPNWEELQLCIFEALSIPSKQEIGNVSKDAVKHMGEK